MKIEKTDCNYQVTECDLKFGEEITLDGEKIFPRPLMTWIKEKGGGEDYYYYRCSKCACCAPSVDLADARIWKLTKYCPECGALRKENCSSLDVERMENWTKAMKEQKTNHTITEVVISDETPKNVRKALQVIQEFCGDKVDCFLCPLSDGEDYSCKLLINKTLPPEFWEIKMED